VKNKPTLNVHLHKHVTKTELEAILF